MGIPLFLGHIDVEYLRTETRRAPLSTATRPSIDGDALQIIADFDNVRYMS